MKYLIMALMAGTIMTSGCGQTPVPEKAPIPDLSVTQKTVCAVPYEKSGVDGIIVNSKDVSTFSSQISVYKELSEDKILLMAGYFTTPYTLKYVCTFVVTDGVPSLSPAPAI